MPLFSRRRRSPNSSSLYRHDLPGLSVSAGYSDQDSKSTISWQYRTFTGRPQPRPTFKRSSLVKKRLPEEQRVRSLAWMDIPKQVADEGCNSLFCLLSQSTRSDSRPAYLRCRRSSSTSSQPQPPPLIHPTAPLASYYQLLRLRRR